MRLFAVVVLLIGAGACGSPTTRDMVPIGGPWHFDMHSSLIIEAGRRPVDLYRDVGGKPVLVAKDPEFYKYYEDHDCMLWETASKNHVVVASCGIRAPFVVAVDEYHRWTMDERGLVSEADPRVDGGRAVRPTVIYPMHLLVKSSEYEDYFDEDQTPDAAKYSYLRPEAVDVPIKVDSTNEAGWPPLMVAASQRNSLAVANALIKQGADINFKDQAGMTALMVAADHSNVDVFRLLMYAGADIHARADDGRTALMYAAGALENQVEMVKMLLDAGADKNLRDRYGNTAFSAIRTNTDPQLKVLLALQ